MLGSYGPREEPYTKDFDPAESPSGLLARQGTFGVRSRVVDDDGEIYLGNVVFLFTRAGHSRVRQTGNGHLNWPRSGKGLNGFLCTLRVKFIVFSSENKLIDWIWVIFGT